MPSPLPQTFTLSGSVSGLVGSVTLQNVGGAQLTVNANGQFAFAGTIAAGSNYTISVAAQPELQTCTVTNGSGTARGNVTNIAISCADATAPTLSLSLLPIKTFRFAWTATLGVTRYKLLEDPTGNSGFAQVGNDSAATVTEHVVPLHRRVNARYKVQACAATRCIDSNTVTASGSLVAAVGYFKASSIGEFDEFGTSVGMDPDNDDLPESGAVYVFVRDSAGPAWVQQAYVKASNAGAGDLFGLSLALDSAGATLAVAARREDSGATGVNGNQGDNSLEEAGAAYVFERSNGSWAQTAYVKASNPGSFDSFGDSLALSGDGRTLAVGARSEDSGASGVGGNQLDNGVANAGAVYVFVKEGPAWRQDAYVKASNPGRNDGFGIEVALSTDGATLAVSATGEDSGATGVNRPPDESADSSGAAYVFARDGQWAQQAFIKASNTDDNDLFGGELALSGDGATLAVAATGEDSAATGINGNESDETAASAGAAYVFVRTGSEWRQQAYVKASDTAALTGQPGDVFGSAMALAADGSMLAIGAGSEDGQDSGIGGDDGDNSAADAGAIYVFERVNDVWAQRAYVKPSNTSSGYRFGDAVALSADGATLAAGASLESGSDPGINGDQNGQTTEGAGAVYLY